MRHHPLFHVLTLLLVGVLWQNVSAQNAPTGNEWQDPTNLSLAKEAPHAWFFDFPNTDDAMKVLPYESNLWLSLDGTWKFNWAPDPDHRPKDFYRTDFDATKWDDLTVPGCWNVQGIQTDGSLKYGMPIYCNQPVIFKHEVKEDDWRGGVMREPAADWTTYKHRNEVGSYRRTFTVPAEWSDKEVYIDFDGVNSFFYLWVNGEYVGFSKNSRNTASFDITKYLTAGENQLAVEVYRSSDGSFLEAQDMWRLPGIYRSVSLRAKSKIQVRDFIIRTEALPNEEGTATMKAELFLKNFTAKKANGLSFRYTIHQCELWKDDVVATTPAATEKILPVLPASGEIYTSLNINIKDAQLWSSEAPHRYIIVGELLDKKGNVLEVFSSFFGICKVEIRDTPAEEDEFGLAGRYFYVNNKTIKFKGVNRQEINPATGNTITKEQIIDEIMLMRRGNINHVRTSHYSNMPFWFYACDKYGIMLEDEANIESHEYYYGKASLSHVPEFKDAHIDRVMAAAHAHVNHPCVIIWSLGNEAGPGENFVAAYNALHEFDSRPVQYERNNDIVDMGSNQYPSIRWTREAVTGKQEGTKYPFHISEYLHSMGNAGGNLEDYWDAIESTNFLCGGAIWDWVDQAIYNYDPVTKQRYLAYGGDFGDKPNSGMFCMNGILYPDHTPKPEFEEVRHVYQYFGVKLLDKTKGLIEIFNKNYFEPMTDVYPVWSIWKDGKQQGLVNTNFVGDKSILGPRERKQLTVPFDFTNLDPASDYHLRVQFLLAKDMPWAKAGFVQAEHEFLLQRAEQKPYVSAVFESGKKGKTLGVTHVNAKDKKATELVYSTPSGMNIVFDKATGTITSLNYGNGELIHEGNGPRINAFRAPVDNDNWDRSGSWTPEGVRDYWVRDGLHAMKATATGNATEKLANGSVKVTFNVTYRADKTYKLHGGETGKNTIEEIGDMPEDGFAIFAEETWTIHPDGGIEFHSNISSNKPETDLARIGYAMQLNPALTEYSYFGRGPLNNYSDRCSGSMTGVYSSTVAEQFEAFPKPQDMANREEVRWCTLADKAGHGIKFAVTENVSDIVEGTAADRIASAPFMSVSALPWSDQELHLAPHPFQLPAPTATHLHLDAQVTGLGGNSCGQGGPLPEDCTQAVNRSFGFLILPF